MKLNISFFLLFCIVARVLVAEGLRVGFEDQRCGVNISSSNFMDVNLFLHEIIINHT